MDATPAPPDLAIQPLTAERWPDLEALFGPRGACGGCWCMWWRLPRPEFKAGKGEGNRRALERYVRGGTVPGLLAYDGDAPVGWVAVEPRDAYPLVGESRAIAKALGAAPDAGDGTWSITCFFVARTHRGRGLMRALVDAAVAHARAHGARAVEAYPVDYDAAVDDGSVYRGAASVFRAAGFEEIGRSSATRPVVRLALSARRYELSASIQRQ